MLDEDCGGAGVCHNEARICVTSCSGATISTPDDVSDRKFCSEFAGKLSIAAGASLKQITAADFPYLTRIRGDLDLLQNLTEATFARLEQVDGTLSLGGSISALRVAAFPMLRTVGTLGAGQEHGIVNATGIVRIEMPLLRKVNGYVNLAFVPKLERVDFGSLEAITGNFDISYASVLNSLHISSLDTIGGALNLSGLPRLPYSTVRSLHDDVTGEDRVAGAIMIEAVGCCFSFGQDAYQCPQDYTCE